MINLKTLVEIKIMKEGGRILGEIAKEVAQKVKPGLTTSNLDEFASELFLSFGVKSAFLGYEDFPASICVSINDEVVHGLPSDRIINEGDLVSIDLGLVFRGFYLDTALTMPALVDGDYYKWSKNNPELHNLLKITREALSAAIKEARVGAQLGQISWAVQAFVEKNGFNVIRQLAGHGIGRQLHEEPQIPNFGRPQDGPKLIEGMVLAIEPMVAAGGWRLRIDPDGFTWRTQDGSPAAHFEHTVAITKNGPYVLTLFTK